VQSTIAITAGLLTMTAAAVTITRHLSAPPDRGHIVAVVKEGAADKPVSGATVEIITQKNALVTMLTPDADGRVRYTVKEGHYRVRVTHPRLAAEARQVYVQGGQTAELHVRLRAEPSGPISAPVGPASTEHVGFFKRLFR
jgi:hypothetical protein